MNWGGGSTLQPPVIPTLTKALRVSIRGLPNWRRPVHPVVHVIPGYAPWKQISNLLTLASTQLGNTLRVENTGSTSIVETATLQLVKMMDHANCRGTSRPRNNSIMLRRVKNYQCYNYCAVRTKDASWHDGFIKLKRLAEAERRLGNDSEVVDLVLGEVCDAECCDVR